jgi:hypothetical protein
MTDNDQARLQELADGLSEKYFHISVRLECGVPYLFAIGAEKIHSVDFRRRDNGLVIEFWRGYPDDDFISEQVVDSFEQALPLIADWLNRDAA